MSMDGYVVSTLKKRVFIKAALATWGTFLLNTLGVWLSLYSIIWWYDMPMHFFGGIFVGLLVIVFFLRSRNFITANIAKSTFMVVGTVVLIGVAWELYEYVFNVSSAVDSLSDLFFDMAGAIQAVLIYLRQKKILTSRILA